MKRLAYFLLLVLALSVGLYVFSPFAPGGNEYVLEESVQIHVSCNKTFDYLGNSDHASQWSVYVSHISPLNLHSHEDGSLHSKRRCFKNSNEEGIAWDEEIVEWEKDKLRTLTIYNLQNFPWKSEGLRTKQKYQTKENGVELTFGLYKSTDSVSFWDSVKLRFTGYFIAYVFRKNLKGIKRELEK